MEPIEMLIIGALVTWATERVADALLNWVTERVRRDRNSKPSEQPEESGD